MDITYLWKNIILGNISLVLTIIYVITILTTAAMVIHEKRDPLKTSTWVLILILLPIIGFIFYIYFGQNYRKQKIFNRKSLKDLQQIETLSKDQLVNIKTENFKKTSSIADNLSIITLLLNNSKALLTQYNHVNIFQTGRRTFEAITKAIQTASSFIHLEFYIIADDKIGNYIKDLLIEKCKEGVEVRLLFDDVGSWNLPKRYINELIAAGAEVYPFMKVTFPLFTKKINYRNHRKILIVDGKVAFMGGINIADRYLKGSPKLGIWYDTVLQIEGEAVKMLQIIFMVDWFFVTQKVVPKSPKYFPPHNVKTKHPLQITASGPDSDWASIMQAFFAGITKAKRHIYISTPYFAPNESILTALKTSALSGVDVKIILPAKSDSTVVYWSSMSYIAEMLEAGINVFLFNKGFNHSKILMIDSSFATVGSANMDIRSFEDNFEVMALIYDKELTIQLENQFIKDIKRSRKLKLKQWNNRPLKQSIKESLARIFSPLF